MAEAIANAMRLCMVTLICLLPAEAAISGSVPIRPMQAAAETDMERAATISTPWDDPGDDGGNVSLIRVEPGRTVEVGEEVFFDGSGVTIEGAELLPNGMVKGSYEWNFGDGYTLMKGSNYYNSDFGGTSTSHFYMRPGTYTVVLRVSDVNGRTKIAATSITVEGREPRLPPRPAIKPLLELKFENNLDDTSGSGLTAVWQNGGGAFAKGIEGEAARLTGASYIEVLDTGGLLSGTDELTISVWAKKKDANTEGYLLDKNQAYYMRISQDKFKVSRDIAGHIVTDLGSRSVRGWPVDEIVGREWHHYVITYNSSLLRIFVDGIEYIRERIAPVELRGRVRESTDSLLIGRGSEDPHVFEGLIDEVKIYDRALTPKDIAVGFELWHADFHGHTAQYIYAQIPTQFTDDPTNRIKGTIEGDNGHFGVLLEKGNLELEERMLLRNSDLPAGNYTLKVQILDAANTVLDELKEEFAKPYEGVPEVGIDENNAIRVNGELFFPVVPWGLEDLKPWAHRYINALNGQTWWSRELKTGEGNLSTWRHYLNRAKSYSLKVIGPARWEVEIGYHLVRNADPKSLEHYVRAGKDDNGMLMWMWGDEPYWNKVPPSVLRSRTYMSHKLDRHHLVDTNYMGHLWEEGTWCERDWGWKTVRRMGYTYLYCTKYFGGKRTLATDVLGFHYFPIHRSDKSGVSKTVEKLAAVWNRIRLENYDLVPILSFVEVSDIDGKGPVPTPEQVRAFTWLNVIKGAKGIKWLPHIKPPLPENFAVMAEFLDHITLLTPVVLGPDAQRGVHDNANEPGNRVDTMIREHEENIWIFATRLTEVNEVNDPAIEVTFTVDGLTSDMAVIEPGMFNQSLWEHHGNKEITVARQTFSFSVDNAPITPGTLQIAGQYKEDGKYRIYLYDDGKGWLYGIPATHPLPTKDMFGRVDYATGRVYVNFGQVKLDWVRWSSASIRPGVDTVTATYRPTTEDRVIPHVGNTFSDKFAPNAVHIYRIPLNNQAGQLPLRQRPLHLPGLRLF